MRVLPLALVCALACSTNPETASSMGNYGVTVSPTSSSCLFPDGSVPETGFDLRLQVQRPLDGGPPELILEGCGATASNCPRTASWDGQILESTVTTARQFEWCGCPMQVVETLRLAIYSTSQSEAVGGQCPSDPFAVPAPTGTIARPGTLEDGYDSLLLCGTAREDYGPYDAGNADSGSDAGVCASSCLGCTRNFSVRGRRR